MIQYSYILLAYILQSPAHSFAVNRALKKCGPPDNSSNPWLVQELLSICFSPIRDVISQTVCIHVQQSAHVDTQGIFLSLTHIHLSFFVVHRTCGPWHRVVRRFNSLIYCPMICLFCCIYRPFTEQIYQERSQRRKHE